MKKIFGILVMMGVLFYSQAAEKEIIKSKISKVTVYSQGAQVHRSANYTVKPGVSKVIIDGVCNSIDPNSLQVKATGNVVILDIQYTLFYPQPEEVKVEGLPLKVRQDISKLEDSIQNLSFEIQSLTDEITVLNATKNILGNNGAIKGQGKVNDSIPLLKEAIEYYTLKMNEINKKLSVLNKRQFENNQAINKMNERLAELRNFQNKNQLQPVNTGPSPQVIVTVQSAAGATGKIDFSYLVASAGWVPLYDLRSEVTQNQVNLNYKANVYQSTGTDWDDVKLTISTNNPYQNKTLPKLHPWYLDYTVYYEKRRNNNAPSAAYNMNTGVVYKQAESLGYSQPVTSDVEKDAIMSNQFMTVVDQMISAEFVIDLPYTIASNGEQHMVLIKNVDLTANYKYYTVPKMDKAAYLVAQIAKLDELQLVPAKANIFFDGSYIGETYIDPSSLSDTLNLSLGKDPNIIVKRTLLKKDCKERLVGSTIEKTFAYLIEVKNLKSSAIDITIQDQLPITQLEDIKIELIDGDKAKYNEVTGLLEWDSKLKSKEIEQIKLVYTVKYEKDKPIYL